MGQWENGKRHGTGTRTCTNGDQYVGQWENSKEHGTGTLTWAKGSRYHRDAIGEILATKCFKRGTKGRAPQAPALRPCPVALPRGAVVRPQALLLHPRLGIDGIERSTTTVSTPFFFRDRTWAHPVVAGRRGVSIIMGAAGARRTDLHAPEPCAAEPERRSRDHCGSAFGSVWGPRENVRWWSTWPS